MELTPNILDFGEFTIRQQIGFMVTIPDFFMSICYNGNNFPGASFNGLTDGANCQVFAYAFLRYYGVVLPPLRSSELWEDSIYTKEVSDYEPFDLLLFHSSPNAFGAHVTVYVGEGDVLHLAKHHNRPIVESIPKILSQDRYNFFIGAKRVICPSLKSPISEYVTQS